MIWLEIHCDIRKEGVDPARITQHQCWSLRGDHPGAMARNSYVVRGLSGLQAEAKRQGWRYKRGTGWICPGCQQDQEMSAK